MKAPARVLDVESTMTGESITMSIDPRDFAHIATVLTDLYSDTELAVIREYSTNARDAHIDFGVTRPIEITLPNPLSSYFKVRDFGEGLDGEDMRTILSKYGASTKRTSNDVVGMLGLGSKSAMTYTDQFTMTGVKDGIMTQVSYKRQDNGVPAIDILYEGPTDEPSGVEVVVPVKRNNLFEEKAEEFFQYWDEGTVLVNGEPPKRVDGVWIADDLLLTTEIDQSVVVMGNVAYPILEDVSITAGGRNRWDNKRGRYISTHVAAFVNIGDVNFVPSREALQPTPTTKATLAKIRDRVAKEKNPAFERIIASAPTKHEALKVYHEVVQVGYTADTPKWNGKIIPLNWEAGETIDPVTKKTTKLAFMTAPGVKTRGTRATGQDRSIPNDPSRFIWIKNFLGAEMTPHKRLKLNQYMERLGHDAPEAFVLVNDLPYIEHPDKTKEYVSEWLDKDHVLDWNVINQEKIVQNKTKTLSGRVSGSYVGLVNGSTDRSILASTIDTTLPIFYEHGSAGRYGVDSKTIDAVQKLHPDATIIVLGGNRIAKFKRDFPMAKETRSYLREAAKAWSDALTDDEKLLLHFNDQSSMRSHLRSMNSLKNTLDDPELVKAIDLAMTNIPNDLLKKWNLFNRYGAVYTYKFPNPLDRYNLLTHMSSYASLRGRSSEHLHLYMNAAYAADLAVEAAEQEEAA